MPISEKSQKTTASNNQNQNQGSERPTNMSPVKNENIKLNNQNNKDKKDKKKGCCWGIDFDIFDQYWIIILFLLLDGLVKILWNFN